MDTKIQARKKYYLKKKVRKKIVEYIIYETMIKIGLTGYLWLYCVANEPENKEILTLPLTKLSGKGTCLLWKVCSRYYKDSWKIHCIK